MKAIWNGETVAEAARDDLRSIEGNWYFPPTALRSGAVSESPTAYHCSWKGDAQYWNVHAAGETLTDGAWSYPEPIAGSEQKAGGVFAGYLAFDPRVQIVED